LEAYTLHLITILRYFLSILLGYACTSALLYSPIAETPILQVIASEAVRGVITLTIGLPASLGIAAAQAAQSIDCLGVLGSTGRFTLLVLPNLILGLLWQRYRLRGGLAALALSGLWQLAIQKPNLWPLAAAGFLISAAFLLVPILFQKRVNHATEKQPL
jgi:hypothetical protein